MTLISWLTRSVDWSLLLPSADCVLLLTDLSCRLMSGTFLLRPSGLVGDIACKTFVWLSRQNRQRDAIHSVTFAAERTSYVWRVNYFDRWSRHIISPNGDDESHSARMIFPGISNSMKARQTTSSSKSFRQDGRISVRSFISHDSPPWW